MEGFREFMIQAINEAGLGRPFIPGSVPPSDPAIEGIIGRVRNLFQRPEFSQAFGDENGLRNQLTTYKNLPSSPVGKTIENILGRIFAHDTPDEAGSKPVLWLLNNPGALGGGAAKHVGADTAEPVAKNIAQAPGSANVRGSIGAGFWGNTGREGR